MSQPTRALLNIGLVTGALSLEYPSTIEAANMLTAINIARKARLNEVEFSHPTGICILDPRRVISLMTVDYEISHAIHLMNMPLNHERNKEAEQISETLEEKNIGIH